VAKAVPVRALSARGAVASGAPSGGRVPESRRLHPTARRILAAAKRILTERGYPALTTQAIATESGVNKAGIWYYFGGKEQLVLALFEEVAVAESHHFGVRPRADATTDERLDLIVGSVEQVKARVARFAAFYQLLPEASRDAELREHLMAYYQGWYAWAREVLAPDGAGDEAGTPARTGQFAAVILDGIFLQMVVAAPDFDLEAALEDARETLRHLLGS
jgi:TetR/AcrR family fatty acid metabolism transcriptional regulator